MTSSRPGDLRAAPADLTGLHDLLWTVRREPALVLRLASDPHTVAKEFDVDLDLVRSVASTDVARLHRLGVNPYLLFFAALALGMDRAAYYEALQGGERRG